MQHSIALVDDDRNILTSVSIALESEGYFVDTYNDGLEALQGIRQRPPDLAILDIKMPRMDGLELLHKLRSKSSIPIIFLTSKDDEFDEALGLKMGADDYVKKPFSQYLLLERIRALLRRRELDLNIIQNIKEEKIKRGDLILDPERHQCFWKKLPLNLTVTEFLLVRALSMRPGIVKTRDQLIDAAYGENIFVDDRTIDSHIKRLRKKFKQLDNNFNEIETLYGLGYRYKSEQTTLSEN